MSICTNPTMATALRPHLKSILRSSDSPKRNASVNFNASVKIIGATNSVPLLAGHETDESLTFEYNPPVAAPPAAEEEPVKGGRGGTMRLKGAGVKDFLSMYSAPAVEEKKKVFEREPCILSGYLKLLKESGMKSTWTKRYFTLKKEEISFFRSAESDKALKTIPLSKNVYVKEISAKTGVADCRNALEISYDRKSSLVLQAASRREATEWITAICAIVDALTKGDDDESFEFYDDDEDDFVDTSAPTTPVHTSTSTPISTYTAPASTPAPAIIPTPTPTPIAVATSTITVATTTSTENSSSSSTRVPVPIVTMTAEELLIIDTNAHATSHDDEFDWVDEDEHESTAAIPVVDDTAAAREREAAAAKQKEQELQLQRQREAEEARQKAEKEREAAAAKERELAAQKQKEADAAKQKPVTSTTTTSTRPTYSTAAKPAVTSTATAATGTTAAKNTFSRAPSAVGSAAARPATNYGRPPTISAPARSFTVPKKLEAHAGLPKSAEAPAAGSGTAPVRESRVSNLLKMWENR